MKVLLIWLWKMWQFHLQNLLQINEISQIYAFDVFEETFKIKNDKIIYSTKLEDFDNLDYDFVDIVAPTKFHYNYLEKYIKLNKNIFVEKPIVSNLEELEKINQIIKESHYTGKIWVGFIERFNVVSKEIKNIINLNGYPYLIEFFRYNPSSNRITDTDISTDLMIHDIDLLSYLTPNQKYNFIWNSSKNHSSIVMLESENTQILLSANSITQQKIREIKVYYEDKTIIWDLLNSSVKILYKPSIYNSEKWQDLNITYMVNEKILPKSNQLKEELDEFISIIQGWNYINLSDIKSSQESINILNKLSK